ncbi:hypothetical protein BV25DRAFT_1843118 [Artomyces pyxidatus]|uniref:Uncharacterized protein n=1 Tax=Artomyces pyxidatus TaxID=48021 RepID=A0ACB8SF69_9AGAM|nr:hypothetical protein BV25DRAFT_1843118 [Artomyces pyxidatus]
MSGSCRGHKHVTSRVTSEDAIIQRPFELKHGVHKSYKFTHPTPAPLRSVGKAISMQLRDYMPAPLKQLPNYPKRLFLNLVGAASKTPPGRDLLGGGDGGDALPLAVDIPDGHRIPLSSSHISLSPPRHELVPPQASERPSSPTHSIVPTSYSSSMPIIPNHISATPGLQSEFVKSISAPVVPTGTTSTTPEVNPSGLGHVEYLGVDSSAMSRPSWRAVYTHDPAPTTGISTLDALLRLSSVKTSVEGATRAIQVANLMRREAASRQQRALAAHSHLTEQARLWSVEAQKAAEECTRVSTAIDIFFSELQSTGLELDFTEPDEPDGESSRGASEEYSVDGTVATANGMAHDRRGNSDDSESW